MGIQLPTSTDFLARFLVAINSTTSDALGKHSIFLCHFATKNTQGFLVGGFNPCEKY